MVTITNEKFESTNANDILARGSFIDGDKGSDDAPKLVKNNKKVFWVAVKLDLGNNARCSDKCWCIRYSWDEDYDGKFIAVYGEKMKKSDAMKLVKVPKRMETCYW